MREMSTVHPWCVPAELQHVPGVDRLLGVNGVKTEELLYIHAHNEVTEYVKFHEAGEKFRRYRELKRQNVPLGRYVLLLELGVKSHRARVVCARSDIEVGVILRGIATGMKAETIVRLGRSVEDYLRLKSAGVKKKNRHDVIRMMLDVRVYLIGISEGLSHKELTSIPSGVLLSDYVAVRRYISHSRALQLSNDGCSLISYFIIRQRGVGHKKAVELLGLAFNSHYYIALREMGLSHREAVRLHCEGKVLEFITNLDANSR